MKKTFILQFLIFMFFTSFSQDVITMKSGDEVSAKVLKIGKTEIEYKKWNNLDGPTFTIDANEVFMIKYQNGDKDVLVNETEIKSNDKKEKQKSNISQSDNKSRFNIDLGYVWQGLKNVENGNRTSWTFHNSATNGLQIGVSWDKTFKHGLGIEFCAFGTELFFEHFSEKVVYTDENNQPLGIVLTDNNFFGWDVYLSPIKFQYRYKITKNIAIFAATGPTLDFALFQKYVTNPNKFSDKYISTIWIGEGRIKNPLYINWDFKAGFSYKFLKLQIGTSVGMNRTSFGYIPVFRNGLTQIDGQSLRPMASNSLMTSSS